MLLFSVKCPMSQLLKTAYCTPGMKVGHACLHTTSSPLCCRHTADWLWSSQCWQKLLSSIKVTCWDCIRGISNIFIPPLKIQHLLVIVNGLPPFWKRDLLASYHLGSKQITVSCSFLCVIYLHSWLNGMSLCKHREQSARDKAPTLEAFSMAKPSGDAEGQDGIGNI